MRKENAFILTGKINHAKEGIAVKTGWTVLLWLSVLMGIAGIVAAQTPVPEGIPAEVRQQIEKLLAGEPGVRGYAAQRLGMMGKETAGAVSFLIPLMVQTAANFEWQADQCRYETDDSRYSSTVAREATEALIRIGEPEVKPLAAVLKIGIPAIRAGAAQALGDIGDPEALKALCEALKVKEETVRQNAASALGKLKDSRAVPVLIVALSQEGPGHTVGIEEALFQIGKPALYSTDEEAGFAACIPPQKRADSRRIHRRAGGGGAAHRGATGYEPEKPGNGGHRAGTDERPTGH